MTPPTVEPAAGGKWDVKPLLITLDAANPSVTHWDLTKVSSHLATLLPPKIMISARIEFTGGPPGWDPLKEPWGPFTSSLDFSPPSKILGGTRNMHYGLYTYDVIVQCADDQGIALNFIVDPQIDNSTPPGTGGSEGGGEHPDEHGHHSHRGKP